MAARDDTTLDFYASEAEVYASRDRTADLEQLDAFLAKLPAGARILELGCGGGQDSEIMLGRGFDVTPTDGSPELALQAEKRLGRPVGILLFGDLSDREAFEGIWANACLLHVPRSDLAAVLGRVHAALTPGGVFCASFKAGSGEGRDRFGRYYNYPSADLLRELYGAYAWQSLDIGSAMGGGYDQEPTQWLYATAVKA